MAAFLLILIVCLCAGCGEQQVKKSELILDTAVTLTAEGADAQAAIDESMARLKNIDSMVNPNVPDSDVNKLAQLAGTGKWVSLQPDVYKMLATAQDYAVKTNGAFDVTTKPLVDLWGIGTDHAKVPSPAELAAAQKLVGWQKLELNEEKQAARLQEKGMGVDLGGIAKGFSLYDYNMPQYAGVDAESGKALYVAYYDETLGSFGYTSAANRRARGEQGNNYIDNVYLYREQHPDAVIKTTTTDQYPYGYAEQSRCAGIFDT